MSALPSEITIGELAARSGVAASALRFYEWRGLITCERTRGGQRRFPRAMLRRVAFIQAAQRVGLTLDEIATALRRLPERRTPTKEDWAVLSRSWRGLLQSRIDELETLQTRLVSCIGCGCLSLKTCALLNPNDRAASRGSGARYLLGDAP
ncbi:MAG TPA: redox-sensitive transcriptional activator SoxR [Candidatus Limnocylindria bacterium]|nr:redox-sensitive transcriptional activator SoxR [Candidatus Limnocylindria bacterium]